MSKKLCKYFRAKSPGMGLVGGGIASMNLENDNLATCWCIKTQGPSAPDGGFASPSGCVEGRSCYKTVMK
jgi:hypothetical protein